jgi:hypothetical protein
LYIHRAIAELLEDVVPDIQDKRGHGYQDQTCNVKRCEPFWVFLDNVKRDAIINRHNDRHQDDHSDHNWIHEVLLIPGSRLFPVNLFIFLLVITSTRHSFINGLKPYLFPLYFVGKGDKELKAEGQAMEEHLADLRK